MTRLSYLWGTEVAVRDFRRGDFREDGALLVASDAGLLVRTPKTRLMLPGGGLVLSTERLVACIEHIDDAVECRTLQADKEGPHKPRPGVQFSATDAESALVTFAVPNGMAVEGARAVMARSAACPGPAQAAQWRSPWVRFRKSLFAVWLVGSLLAVLIGLWGASSIQSVSARVDAVDRVEDGGRICLLAWTDPVTEAPRTAANVTCNTQVEEGSRVPAYLSPVVGEPDLSRLGLIAISTLWVPALATVVLGIVVALFGLASAALFAPQVNRIDERRMREATSGSLGVMAMP